MIDALERPNIKDFVVGDPVKKQESFPDPRKEVTKDQWDALATLSRNALIQRTQLTPDQENDTDADILHNSINALALAAPEKVKDMMDNATWEILISQMRRWDIKRMQRINSGAVFLEKALSLKLLSPQRAKESQIITDDQWTQIKEDFESSKKSQNEYLMNQAVDVAAQVNLFDPKKAKDFDLGDECREFSENQIKEYENMFVKDKDMVQSLVNELCCYKLAEPDRYKKLSFHSGTWQRIWEYQKSELKRLLDSDVENAKYGDFASDSHGKMYECMILAADEIQSTESGVKFVFNKQTVTKSDPGEQIPEVRKF